MRDGQIIGRLAGLETVQERIPSEVRRRQEDQTSRITARQARLADADGATLLLSISCSEAEDSLAQVEQLARSWAHENRGDETLSGRLQVEVGYPAEQRDQAEELERLARDLEAFLNRQLAGLQCGPHEDRPFTLRLRIRFEDDPPTAESDDRVPSPEEASMSDANAQPNKNPFTEDEQKLLADAPFLVFLVVAGADGNIDKKEARAFQQALVEAASSTHPVVHQMFASGLQDPQGRIQKLISGSLVPSESLEAAGELLARKLPQDEANAVKMALVLVGKHVAEASGGFFGFGKKMSKDEKQALAAVLMLLDIQLS